MRERTEKTSSEDATVEGGAEFASDEASNGCSLLARIGENGLEVFGDDFVEKRFLGLVALILDGAGSAGDVHPSWRRRRRGEEGGRVA